MESDTVPSEHQEEEYVLLDLDSVYSQLQIPPNAPYVLSVWSISLQDLVMLYINFSISTLCNAILMFNGLDFQGLDTMQPVLILDDKFKLVSFSLTVKGLVLVFFPFD